MNHACDLRPATDSHTHELLETVVEQLRHLRGLPPDIPAVRVHLIGSLLLQGETTLTRAVCDTLDHGHTDLEIRTLLGLG